MRPSWDEHWMAHARLNAEMGTCIRRKVGVVAVRDRRLIAAGFNGNLPGMLHCDEGGCERCASDAPSGTGLDDCVCCHAEENLLMHAARNGVALDGVEVYCTHHPCGRCMRILELAGVMTVYYADDYPTAYDISNIVTVKL